MLDIIGERLEVLRADRDSLATEEAEQAIGEAACERQRIANGAAIEVLEDLERRVSARYPFANREALERPCICEVREGRPHSAFEGNPYGHRVDCPAWGFGAERP